MFYAAMFVVVLCVMAALLVARCRRNVSAAAEAISEGLPVTAAVDSLSAMSAEEYAAMEKLWDDERDWEDDCRDSRNDDDTYPESLSPAHGEGCDCATCESAAGRDWAVEQAEKTGDWSNL